MDITTLHILLLLFYVLYLIIKPDNEEDQYFILKRQESEKELYKIITDLETTHKQDYSTTKKRITSYFADNRLTTNESIKIEQYLVDCYFQGFKDRLLPFKKADLFLKSLITLTLIISFIYFNSIIYFVAKENGLLTDNFIFLQIGISILLFIVPLVFCLLQLGLLSMLLLMFSFMFSSKGSLRRVQIIIDEIIKSIKPGGRTTTVGICKPTINDIPRFR
jgi:hypothetical protein